MWSDCSMDRTIVVWDWGLTHPHGEAWLSSSLHLAWNEGFSWNYMKFDSIFKKRISIKCQPDTYDVCYSCCLQTFSHLLPSTGIGTQEHPRHNLLGAKSCSWVQPNKLSIDWSRLHCAPHRVGPVLLNHVSCVLNWTKVRREYSSRSLSEPGLYLHRAGALPTPWSPVWEKIYFYRFHVYFQIYVRDPQGNQFKYLWKHIMVPHVI